MYNIELSEAAKSDLFRIYEYGITRFGVKQADAYFTMMYDCFEKIASNPFLFPDAIRYREGYRFCVCGVDTIFYQVIENDVRIMAIIGRQHFL